MGAAMSVALACAVTVLGQPGAPVDDAKTYFEAGQQAYRAGFYLDAARAFEQAYELVPNPAIIFSLGQTYRRQFLLDGEPEHLRRSIQSYRQYLQEVPRGGRREDAIENLGDLEQRRLALGLAPIDAERGDADRPRKTQVMVSSQTEGAVAAIDGAEPQPVPLVMEIEPGKHSVLVEAPGHFSETRDAVAIEGRLVVAQVDLRPQPATLKVRGTSGAQVTVDGRLVGKVPFPAAIEVPAGRHVVAASQSGRHPFRREVDAKRGEALELVADLETTTQRQVSYWFIGGGAVLMASSAVLVAIGLVSEGQARLILRKRDVQMENLSPSELDRYISARDRRNDLLTVSSGALVGALVVGGIGAALYFLDDSDPVFSPSGISPLVSPDGTVGVGWQGTF